MTATRAPSSPRRRAVARPMSARPPGDQGPPPLEKHVDLSSHRWGWWPRRRPADRHMWQPAPAGRRGFCYPRHLTGSITALTHLARDRRRGSPPQSPAQVGSVVRPAPSRRSPSAALIGRCRGPPEGQTPMPKATTAEEAALRAGPRKRETRGEPRREARPGDLGDRHRLPGADRQAARGAAHPAARPGHRLPRGQEHPGPPGGRAGGHRRARHRPERPGRPRPRASASSPLPPRSSATTTGSTAASRSSPGSSRARCSTPAASRPSPSCRPGRSSSPSSPAPSSAAHPAGRRPRLHHLQPRRHPRRLPGEAGGRLTRTRRAARPDQFN